MKIISRYFIICLAFAGLSLSSCKEKNQLEVLTETNGNYFSIKQYIIDEWTSHIGEPTGFKKTVKEHGKVDTSFTNIELMDWPSVLDVFIATDISDKKFLNKYTFSDIDDEMDRTKNFMYVANREDMYVQKFLITMDMDTHKVRGIYIETHNKKFMGAEVSQKLLYTPFKTIQIQEFTKPLIGSETQKLTQYDVIK